MTRLLSARLIPLLLLCLGLTVTLFSCKPSCDQLLDEFETEIRRSVDPDVLQVWALSVIEQFKQDGISDRPRVIPDSIQRFQRVPPISLVVGNEPANRKVLIQWRTEYGTRGLIVGKPGLMVTNTAKMCVHQWKPGVYVFYTVVTP